MFLVTGGAGFIGSHLVERLVKEKKKVRVIDNFVTGTKGNLNPFIGKIELVEGNILNLELLRKVVQGVDIVFHQAALRSVPLSIDNPLLADEVNVRGTLNLLVASRDADVKKVIYASSSSVYGDSPDLPKAEDQRPAPISPYAVSKLAGEHYCLAFTKVYRLETIALRYFNVFGPRQDPQSQYAAVIPRFVKAALMGQPLEVHGDGLQSRDFTYVDDVIEANLRAARAPEAVGKVINVAQGNAFSVLDIAKSLQLILGRELELVHTSSRTGDVRHTLADISLAAQVLGYQPSVTFEDGLVRTVRYLEAQF